MKKIYTILTLVLFAINVFSQAPSAFNYQAVLRDASGNIRANASVSIRIDLLQTSVTGTTVYAELFAATTNGNGLINLQIGKGALINGAFSTINWGDDPYFIKVSVDNTDMGTSQLLAVPYAKYAEKAGNGFSGNYDDLTKKPAFTKWDKDSTDNVTITGNQTISGDKTFNGTVSVPNPVTKANAVTKAYVDSLFTQLYAQGALRIRDFDGNYYNSIKIGTQIWMTENLKTAHFADGTAITLVTDNTVWSNLTTSAYCIYNNSATITDPYGAMYNYYTVIDNHKLCPSGWHIPSDTEFETLQTYLGGSSIAGGKLKEVGTTHWKTPNSGATNETGFTALPGGLHGADGIYKYLTTAGYWWSLTSYSTTNALIFSTFQTDQSSSRFNDSKKDGLSVRCLKD